MSIETMKMALHALNIQTPLVQREFELRNLAIEALRQAIEQAEKQEPAVWMIQYKDRHDFVWGSKPEFRGDIVLGIEPLYTAPPKREWVGLTEDEVLECFDSVALGAVEKENVIDKRVNIFNAIKAIEAKLKEKNGG